MPPRTSGWPIPTALPVAVAAAQVVQLVGLPEARIALAQATIHLATAPKSNAVIIAIDAAMADVREGKAGSVPPALRDGHYPGAAKLGNAQTYVYPHDRPGSVVRSSTRPTNWSVGTTTSRPATAPNGHWPNGCRSCAGPSAATGRPR